MRLMAGHADDLLERFVAGDAGAFIEFYRQHLRQKFGGTERGHWRMPGKDAGSDV